MINPVKQSLGLAALFTWLSNNREFSSLGSFTPTHHPAQIYTGRSGTMKGNLRKLRKRQGRRAHFKAMRGKP